MRTEPGPWTLPMIRILRRAGRRALFLLLCACAGAGALFGRHGVAAVGHAVGRAGAAAPTRARARLRADIAGALGLTPGQAAEVLRRARRSNDRAVVEVLALGVPWTRAAPLIDSCRVLGTEHLPAGRGAVLLGMHMGNGILMAAQLAHQGFPVSVAYRESRKIAPGYLGRCLTRAGVKPIHLPRDAAAAGLRALMRDLADGRLIYILMDQGDKQGGFETMFLGKRAHMPTTVVRLVQRTGCPLIPVLPESADDGWDFRVHQPLALPDDPDEAMAMVVDTMAGHIAAHPELWTWHHRRWRRDSLVSAAPSSDRGGISGDNGHAKALE
jgi:lauroyl/myristoyl acyltransferase